MLLIIGLGNPGGQYAYNRHNIGFMAVDDIQRTYNFSPWSKKFQALISEGKIGSLKILLIKPQTYMNLSGQSVGEAMRFYKVPLEDLIVIHDELDLPAGKIRIKTGGGSGGHNGIKSIDAHCGANYRRLRLGIGHPGQKELVHNHVLGDFAKADSEWLEPLLKNISDNIADLGDGKDSQFMNKVAGTQNNKSKQHKTNEMEKTTPTIKQQSHIKEAHNNSSQTKQTVSQPAGPQPAGPQPAGPQPAGPQPTGPMADMLKKLFGNRTK